MNELRTSKIQNERSSSFFSKMFCSFGSSRSNASISGYEIDIYEILLTLLLLRLETACFCSLLATDLS